MELTIICRANERNREALSALLWSAPKFLSVITKCDESCRGPAWHLQNTSRATSCGKVKPVSRETHQYTALKRPRCQAAQAPTAENGWKVTRWSCRQRFRSRRTREDGRYRPVKQKASQSAFEGIRAPSTRAVGTCWVTDAP